MTDYMLLVSLAATLVASAGLVSPLALLLRGVRVQYVLGVAAAVAAGLAAYLAWALILLVTGTLPRPSLQIVLLAPLFEELSRSLCIYRFISRRRLSWLGVAAFGVGYAAVEAVAKAMDILLHYRVLDPSVVGGIAYESLTAFSLLLFLSVLMGSMRRFGVNPVRALGSCLLVHSGHNWLSGLLLALRPSDFGWYDLALDGVVRIGALAAASAILLRILFVREQQQQAGTRSVPRGAASEG